MSPTKVQIAICYVDRLFPRNISKNNNHDFHVFSQTVVNIEKVQELKLNNDGSNTISGDDLLEKYHRILHGLHSYPRLLREIDGTEFVRKSSGMHLLGADLRSFGPPVCTTDQMT